MIFSIILAQVLAASPVKAGTAAAAAAAAAGKSKPAAIDQLAAGPFSISPAVGNLAPGERQSLAISFAPAAAQTFEEQLVLDVSDRYAEELGINDCAEEPQGFRVGLIGSMLAARQ